MGAIRFGANGWYARVGQGFDEDSVARIAHALGSAWEPFAGSTVMLGYDVRRDSRAYAQLVGEVLAAHGLCAVISDRICPTPALGWSVAQDGSCIGGVMLSASRRPHEYGGIMVRRSDGGPMSSAFAQLVQRRIESSPSDLRGKTEEADLVSAYLERMVGVANLPLISSAGMRVVLDPLYGAGAGSMRSVLERVGCEVIALHDSPVPDFRGLHPDAHEPWVDECERMVIEQQADLGIVFDGDCDRMSIVDETGHLLSPHDMVPLVLEHLVSQRGMGGRVVATVGTSARVRRKAGLLGCDYTMVAVGYESLYREFGEGDVIFATDASGGVCVPSHLPERDGLLGALMLLEAFAGADEKVSDYIRRSEEELGRMDYVARDIRLDSGLAQRLQNLLPGLNPPEVLGEMPVRVSHADGLRLELEDGSWLLLRVSRSASAARVVAEAPTPARARALASFAAALARP